MVQFNFSERTIKAKVVYYGPAQSGKTTNLEQIHRLTDPAGRNRLISLNTAQDRTLFFDLLPFSLGSVSGYDFKIQLYTVPGQVQYNATRRVVLAGADAVVFVADSRRTAFKDNVSAFENMKVNLLANRLVPEKIPLVLQYNKRDMPDGLGVAELNKALNPWQRPHFTATATKPEGVLETFISVIEQTLTAIALKYGLKDKGLDPAQVPQLVASAFEALAKQRAEAPADSTPETAGGAAGGPAAGGPISPARIVMSQAAEPSAVASTPSAADGSLVAEDLLHRAIRSNVELAEALGDLIRDIHDGLGGILAQADFLLTSRDAPPDRRQAAAKTIQDGALRLRSIVHGLGRRVAEARPGEPRPATPAVAPVQPAAAPRQPAAVAAVAGAAAAAPTANLEGILRQALQATAPVLSSRSLTVELRVTPGTPVPRGPTGEIERVVVAVLTGLARVATAGGAVFRCELKPVLLKSAAGDVRRNFVMLAIAHGGGPNEQEQQRILQGFDQGPMGEAYRAIRGMGGFIRFAPLAGGSLETRVFLPEA